MLKLDSFKTGLILSGGSNKLAVDLTIGNPLKDGVVITGSGNTFETSARVRINSALESGLVISGDNNRIQGTWTIDMPAEDGLSLTGDEKYFGSKEEPTLMTV